MREDNWKHRSNQMKCKTCMHYKEKSAPIERCRRHAPTMQGFPVVYETDWCGDHKLDEEKVDKPVMSEIQVCRSP